MDTVINQSQANLKSTIRTLTQFRTFTKRIIKLQKILNIISLVGDEEQIVKLDLKTLKTLELKADS